MRTHGHREGSITHWGLLRVVKGGTVGWGEEVREREHREKYQMWVTRGLRQQTTLPCVYLCNNPACSSHVPQNPECNKKYIYIKSLVLKELIGWRQLL